MHGLGKNQSALFTDYGFTSSEFNLKYSQKQINSIENDGQDKIVEKKRKSKLK